MFGIGEGGSGGGRRGIGGSRRGWMVVCVYL